MACINKHGGSLLLTEGAIYMHAFSSLEEFELLCDFIKAQQSIRRFSTEFLILQFLVERDDSYLITHT